MNAKDFRREVFMFSKWGKLISTLETFVVLIVFSLSAIYGLSRLDGSIKDAHMFKSLVIAMVTFSLIISFLLTFVKAPTAWFLWRILPMNRKVAIRYLKDRQQKLEKKIADSDDYLKQLSDDYHEAIDDHAKGLEEAKKDIEEIKQVLAIYK